QRLEALMQSGAFPEDLYYRLNVIPVLLPPLRDRLEDLPLLVEHFLHQHGGAVAPKRLSREALALLMRYTWPGNVRELENLIERLVVLSRREEIGVEDLPAELRAVDDRFLAQAAERSASLAAIEQEYIHLVLARADGNQSRAAEILGIDRRTLSRKLQEYRRPTTG
ncbi:MAG: helix-turn-helix domain-containing protein, partial [Candidatus Latescibacterota bacterium]